MISHPFSSTYTAAQNTYSANSMLSSQLSSNKYTAEELNQMAKASRAKRLDSLLKNLQALIELAANDPNPLEAAKKQKEYFEYVVSRLQGDPDAEAPDSFGAMAYEIESLIDDVLEAWNALLNDNYEEFDTPQKFQSIDGVLAMLNHIANRRVTALMNSYLYQQWRHMYRDFDEDSPMNFSPDAQNTRHLPSSDAQLSQENVEKTYPLLEMLNAATQIQDHDGNYLVSEDKRQQVQSFFSELAQLLA